MALNNRQNYWQQQRAQGAPRPGAFARQRRLPPGAAAGRYNPYPPIPPGLGGFNGGDFSGGPSNDLNDFTRGAREGIDSQGNPLRSLTDPRIVAQGRGRNRPGWSQMRGGPMQANALTGQYPGGNMQGGSNLEEMPQTYNGMTNAQINPYGFSPGRAPEGMSAFPGMPPADGISPSGMGVGYNAVMPSSYNAGRAPVQYQGNQQALTGQTRQQRPWGMQQQQRLNQAMQRGNFGR